MTSPFARILLSSLFGVGVAACELLVVWLALLFGFMLNLVAGQPMNAAETIGNAPFWFFSLSPLVFLLKTRAVKKLLNDWSKPIRIP